MGYGSTGKLLRVDLTRGTTSVENLDEAFYRMYPGGKALAAYLLLRERRAGIAATELTETIRMDPTKSPDSAHTGIGTGEPSRRIPPVLCAVSLIGVRCTVSKSRTHSHSRAIRRLSRW